MKNRADFLLFIINHLANMKRWSTALICVGVFYLIPFGVDIAYADKALNAGVVYDDCELDAHAERVWDSLGDIQQILNQEGEGIKIEIILFQSCQYTLIYRMQRMQQIEGVDFIFVVDAGYRYYKSVPGHIEKAIYVPFIFFRSTKQDDIVHGYRTALFAMDCILYRHDYSRSRLTAHANDNNKKIQRDFLKIFREIYTYRANNIDECPKL